MKTGKEIRQALASIAKDGNKSCRYKSQKYLAKRLGLNPKDYAEMKCLENQVYRSKKIYAKTSKEFDKQIKQMFKKYGKEKTLEQLYAAKHNYILNIMYMRGQVLVVGNYVNPSYNRYIEHCDSVVENSVKAVQNLVESSKSTGVPTLESVKRKTDGFLIGQGAEE